MREKPLQRRTPYYSKIRNEDDFRKQERLWLRDQIADWQYILLCLALDRIRRRSRGEMVPTSYRTVNSPRGSDQR